jgi:hypothetical protein
VSVEADTAITSGKPAGAVYVASLAELPAEATATTPEATMRHTAACSSASASNRPPPQSGS